MPRHLDNVNRWITLLSNIHRSIFIIRLHLGPSRTIDFHTCNEPLPPNLPRRHLTPGPLTPFSLLLLRSEPRPTSFPSSSARRPGVAALSTPSRCTRVCFADTAPPRPTALPYRQQAPPRRCLPFPTNGGHLGSMR
jgi:hypothetical protein